MVEKMAKLFLIDSGPDYLRATIVLVLIIVFFCYYPYCHWSLQVSS